MTPPADASGARVLIEPCREYEQDQVDRVLAKWDGLFADTVRPGDVVVLKPNWLAHSHKYKPDEWQSVITHPTIITGALRMALRHLRGSGRIVIADSPQTDSSWRKIMGRMCPERWVRMGEQAGVDVTVLDLREDEWTSVGDVYVDRRKLAGDPLGSTECDLQSKSEFVDHRPSVRGYYGADYDTAETTAMHTNAVNKYRISRTVASADVFVNLPKLKTHKKAGITCSLKNLVGINTYKNWLPHHTEGTPDQGGDQFPSADLTNKAERWLIRGFRDLLLDHQAMAKWLVPVKRAGKSIFGDTQKVVRSGNWYGNDTLWRTILDLNKILLYANPDGSLRDAEPHRRKRYISIVDGVIAGDGNGPEAPDAKACGLLIAGTNPVGVDATCARVMGLDWQRIPSIRNAFSVKELPICDFAYRDIVATSSLTCFNGALQNLATEALFQFKPHFGWVGHLEAR